MLIHSKKIEVKFCFLYFFIFWFWNFNFNFFQEIELVVNLGFEDSAVEDNEEIIVKNETKEPDNQNFVLNENTEQFHLKKRDFNILDEKDEFKQ